MTELYFYVRENLDKLDWDELSKNEGAIELLLEFPERINWDFVSLNKNKNKKILYKKYPEKINWKRIGSYDKLNDMSEYLKENIEIIDWILIND